MATRRRRRTAAQTRFDRFALYAGYVLLLLSLAGIATWIGDAIRSERVAHASP